MDKNLDIITPSQNSDFLELIERSELGLSVISLNDTFSELVDKLNRNFNLIKEFQGGRQGIPGEQGPPGSSNLEINNYDNLDDDLITFINKNSIINSCQINEIENLENIISELNSTKIILNKKANFNIILTNIFKDSLNNLNIASRWDDEESFETGNLISKDFKLTILNSDENGNGKHIFLGNSKKMISNRTFFCKSGFGIENTTQNNNNYEFLKIKGFKNDEINHTQFLDVYLDFLRIAKNEKSQKLIFDSGSEIINSKSGILQLQNQTKNNIFRLSNKTGWIGIWEDTLNNEEFWEKIEFDKIKINEIKFSTNSGTYIETQNENIPLLLVNDSEILFKRLNNFVLIDFKIKLLKKSNINNLILHSVSFINNLNIFNCFTHNWLVGSVYSSTFENNKLNFDLLDFTHVRINNYNFLENNKENKSFEIIIKLKDLNINQEINSIVLGGQLWATVDNFELCETLIIDEDVSCTNIEII